MPDMDVRAFVVLTVPKGWSGTGMFDAFKTDSCKRFGLDPHEHGGDVRLVTLDDATLERVARAIDKIACSQGTCLNGPPGIIAKAAALALLGEES